MRVGKRGCGSGERVCESGGERGYASWERRGVRIGKERMRGWGERKRVREWGERWGENWEREGLRVGRESV